MVAKVYDVWEDPSILSGLQGSDVGASVLEGFSYEGWVCDRVGAIARKIAWVNIRAASSFSQDNPKAHESALNRLNSCLMGYRSIFPGTDFSSVVGKNALLVHTDIDLPIVEWVGFQVEEAEDSLKWFVTIAKWHIANRVLSSSSISSSDGLLTPEEFAIAKSNSAPRQASKLANRITNQVYSEFRSFQTLYSKISNGA